MSKKQRNCYLTHFFKSEDASNYAKQANEGLMVAYPVEIKGQSHRPDNNIHYHATVKTFDPQTDHAHRIHELAKELPLNPPDKHTQIEPSVFKDKNNNDVFVLTLKGRSADKIKENNSKLAPLAAKQQPYDFQAHITVPESVWHEIKNSGAKTAHEAEIKFGHAELKRGPQTLKTYHLEHDTSEPELPDYGDRTSKMPIESDMPSIAASEKNILPRLTKGKSPNDDNVNDEDAHALLNRKEDKYFLPRRYLDKVVAELSTRFALGDIDTDTRYCHNRTIYLDDKDLTSFKDVITKNLPRVKVRIRQYCPNGKEWESVAYAEFKVKDEDGQTKKLRVRIPAKFIDELAEGGKIFFDEDLVNINRDIERRLLESRVHAINNAISERGLKKQIEVQYERRAYTGNELRITIDDNLNFFDAREIDPTVKSLIGHQKGWNSFIEPYIKAAWENPLILEVKSGAKVPRWMERLLEEVEATKQSFSKYCSAIITHLKTEGLEGKILSIPHEGPVLSESVAEHPIESEVVDVNKAEDTSKLAPLSKPYVSEAQRRWAHTAAGKKALGGNAGVHEWDEATKGKKLPERVSKSEDKPILEKALKFGSAEDQKVTEEALKDRKENPEKYKTDKKSKITSPRLTGEVKSKVAHVKADPYDPKREIVHLESGHDLHGHPAGKFKAGDEVVAKPHISGTHVMEHLRKSEDFLGKTESEQHNPTYNVGQTSSGKTINSHFSHPSHADLTPEEHMDAAKLHGVQVQSAWRLHQQRGPRTKMGQRFKNAAQFHIQQAELHRNAANKINKSEELSLEKSSKFEKPVDIAVVVLHDGNFILIGKRRKNDKWGLPGGRTEGDDESNKTAAVRELEEETGLTVNPDDLTLAGIREIEGKKETKRVHVYIAEYPGGEPTTKEDPDKEFSKWRWFRCEDGILPDEILDDEMNPPAKAAFDELAMTKAEDQIKTGQSSAAPAVKINPEHGKTIANAYEQMKHDPSHPDVKAAYNALINETGNQFKDIMGSGLKISRIKPGQQNPYKNSKEMHHDIENNKHLWYFPTEQGFGSKDQTNDHPMLSNSGFTHEGQPLLANDVFRIVHDINGHHAGGKTGFGPTGEHQAYLTHKQKYSPLAAKALATETMGQNNWVNHGPHGEHNRKNPSQTIFADQKAGLLPEHIINGDWHNAT